MENPPREDVVKCGSNDLLGLFAQEPVRDREQQDGTVTGGNASGWQDKKPQVHTEPASSWQMAFGSLTLPCARCKADA